MFNKDFIYHKRHAYSQEGCSHAINFFEKRVDLQQPGSFADGRISFEWKKCTEMYLKRKEYTLFEDVLQTCMKEYEVKYTTNASLKLWDLAPAFKIQKYEPGEGYFGEHCECDGNNSSDPYRISRVVAWMVYLNDVNDGGYTNFPNQKRRFQPRRGDILLWPAYFTHTHYGITSKTQTKYIATGWCCFKKD